MVARTQPFYGELVVSFMRDGEPAERTVCRDGNHACENAIAIISRRETLQAGDLLSVNRHRSVLRAVLGGKVEEPK